MSKQEGKGQENQQQEELLKFPYEIKELEADLNSKLLQTFLGERTGGYVQVGYKNWFLPKKYKQDAKFYYNFKVRSDDVFVVTFPRSGTTWTQEMVWLLSNRLDYKTAKETPLNHRYTFLEFYSLNTDEGFVNLLGRKVTPSWIGLGQESLGKRRFIKSHLPLELLPPDLLCSRAKVVYVARNPKDVVVSYYHFAKANPFYGFDGEFGEFWELFRQNLIHWAPYWEHVKEAWTRRRGNENFLFIFYEDMIKDLKETVNKVSIFLGQSYSSEQLDQLVHHLKFDNFKNNNSVNAFADFRVKLKEGDNNRFIRKGQMGNWHEYFTGNLEKEVEDWIEENLKDTDLRFPI